MGSTNKFSGKRSWRSLTSPATLSYLVSSFNFNLNVIVNPTAQVDHL